MKIRPAILSPRWWSVKRLAILIGFLLTVIGALGPQFYVGPVEDRAAEVDLAARTLAARIDNLRAAQSQYLLFQQMGVLVYALDATGVAAGGSAQGATSTGSTSCRCSTAPRRCDRCSASSPAQTNCSIVKPRTDTAG